ncbi:hypothetical protein, partial [Streptomyces mirabilis]|uniref:hypothetical protein n=1 Tax=Streptomyces mirabilis TaxID=68239 RepID=UPI0033CFB8D2
GLPRQRDRLRRTELGDALTRRFRVPGPHSPTALSPQDVCVRRSRRWAGTPRTRRPGPPGHDCG